MSIPSSVRWFAVLVAVCAISYGLGNGWIRLGSPSAMDARPSAVVPDPSRFDPVPPVAREARIDAALLRAEDGQTPTPAASTRPNTPSLSNEDKKRKIEEALKKATGDLIEKLKTEITGAASFSNDPNAEDKIRKTADTAALNVFLSAINAQPAPASATAAEYDRFLSGRVADSTVVARAETAARDAIKAAGKQFAEPRDAFKGDEVAITYKMGMESPKPLVENTQIEGDGPSIKFEAKVKIKSTVAPRKFDDSGAEVTLELRPRDGFRPYLELQPVQQTAPSNNEEMTLSIETSEAGLYELRVTLSPQGRDDPIVFTRAVEVRPKPTPVVTLKGLQALQNDRIVTFELQGSSPIEVGSGRLTLTSKIDVPGHTLIVINADAEAAMLGKLKAPITAPVKDAAKDVVFPATIPDETLLDKPTRIAVADLWSHESSSGVTLVIPGGVDGLPSQTVGVGGAGGTGDPGKNAVFAEYTDPRRLPDGFKPSDKVETRVVRLYYYRDAHRVAQIVNRDVRSRNRIAVDTRRRMADKARDEADGLTDARRLSEIRSVRGAQTARAAEQKVRKAQNDLDAALKAEQTARDELPVLDSQIGASADADAEMKAEIETLKKDVAAAKAANPKDDQEVLRLTAALSSAQTRQRQEEIRRTALTQKKSNAQAVVDGRKSDSAQIALTTAQKEVQTARDAEAASSDLRVRDEQLEDRARENQFRQEVAAAHEDPDTYVAGVPTSADPVLQVSVSVIGEGLIQLRGPIKGINVIRTMINQIDAPTSQVRVAIHTLQINGERGDRMEKVATRIQDYVDHSRFLTTQSAQMLRNAVVKVAAQKAHDAAESCPNVAAHRPGVVCPDDSQAARDARYQEAFFGCDFINELRAIDSEFLMTGNKLLSLHSMDTTSLASALFLIALAKNDVREEILAEFQRAMQFDLPAAETNYFAAGAVGRPKDHHNDFKLFAYNARFQSFRGFFNAQVAGSETLNPLQREFLKLAQIFKSRLVTELEYNQRVKERGLLEDRIDPIVDRDQARKDEKAIRESLKTAYTKMIEQQNEVLKQLSASHAEVQASQDAMKSVVDEIERLCQLNFNRIEGTAVPSDRNLQGMLKRNRTNFAPSENVTFQINKKIYEFQATDQIMRPLNDRENDAATPEARRAKEVTRQQILDLVHAEKQAIDDLQNFVVTKNDDEVLKRSSVDLTGIEQTPNDLTALEIQVIVTRAALEIRRIGLGLRAGIAQVNQLDESLIEAMGSNISQAQDLLAKWTRIKIEVRGLLRPGGRYRQAAETQIASIDAGFRGWLQANVQYEGAKKIAAVNSRPLDHKRLLDMLIDDVEDKYIDLLEGTRSHTANIDAYIKNIATALDDDFNTQFYYPAFTAIRGASRFHDVSLGKIETTNVLANNRGFGKVDPQATMEFDLPKRDILINEAMNGALAMTKDFGALVNDPTFLSLAKLRSGQPTSSLTTGAGEGVNTVRNALPGLSRADDEQLFSQQGAGRTQFGSAMEALIPDPAVYKFETGTGFEIRPVVQPDGQSVVFHFNYMYTTNVREPVRADEKHLGRVKRHNIDTDVQLGNYELREVSRYQVALKASRTSRGVPLFEDIPGLGVLFRPLPSAESSLQENIVLGQSTIFPTLFDLMGLRWAPAVADLDTLRLRNDNFIVRGRYRDIQNKVFDISSGQLDEFLQIPAAERRPDLYRTQQSIPDVHPNGYHGPGLNYQDVRLREGYDPARLNPERGAIPGESRLANPRGPAPGREPPVEPEAVPIPTAPIIEEGAEYTPAIELEASNAPRPTVPTAGRIPPPVRYQTAPRIATRPAGAPPRQPAPAHAPAAAPVRSAPATGVPPLNGPAPTNWQRSVSPPSASLRVRDDAVRQSGYEAPRPAAPAAKPGRRSLFSRLSGAGR